MKKREKRVHTDLYSIVPNRHKSKPKEANGDYLLHIKSLYLHLFKLNVSLNVTLWQPNNFDPLDVIFRSITLGPLRSVLGFLSPNYSYFLIIGL